MLAMAEETYLKELLQNMQRSIDGIDKEQQEQRGVIEKIHLQTQKTNGRVNALEKDKSVLEKAVDVLQKSTPVVVKTGTKIPVINDKFLSLMALAAVIIVVIVAALLKVDISGVF